MVGRKNNPGMAFNPLNLQYDNSVQGEILKRRDEESKYRAWLRSINMDKHGNTGYNIINGEERTILEERLNKDILPDLIQKNIDQINEMKNKVVFNYIPLLEIIYPKFNKGFLSFGIFQQQILSIFNK